jgi:hypothetical protein
MTTRPRSRYVLCLSNTGYAASLEPRKVYRTIPDAAGAKHGLLRVVDESGDDYLYPKDMFAPVSLSRAIERAIATN